MYEVVWDIRESPAVSVQTEPGVIWAQTWCFLTRTQNWKLTNWTKELESLSSPTFIVVNEIVNNTTGCSDGFMRHTGSQRCLAQQRSGPAVTDCPSTSWNESQTSVSVWSEPAHIWTFVSLAETLDADILIRLEIMNIIINQLSLFCVRSHHHVLFGPLCFTWSIRWVWWNCSSCWVFLLLLLQDKLHVGSRKKRLLRNPFWLGRAAISV